MWLARALLFLFVAFLFIHIRIEGVTLYKLTGVILAFVTFALLRRIGARAVLADRWIQAIGAIALTGLLGSIGSGLSFQSDLFKAIQNIVLYATVVLVASRLQDIRTLLLAAAGGGLVAVVTGLLELGTSSQLRVGGLFGNPNGYGYACAEVVVCLIGLALIQRQVFKKTLCVLLTAPCIVGLLYSASRAAFLSMLVSLLILTILSRKKHLGLALVVLLCLSAVYIAPAGYLERLQRAFVSVKAQRLSGIEQRMLLLNRGWTIFKQNPVFGIGPGNTRYAMVIEHSMGLVTHNTFMQALVETGVVGAGAFGLLLIWTGYGQLRLVRDRSQPSELQVLALVYLAWFGGKVVFGLSHGTYLSPQWYIVFAVTRNLLDHARQRQIAASQAWYRGGDEAAGLSSYNRPGSSAPGPQSALRTVSGSQEISRALGSARPEEPAGSEQDEPRS